MLVVLPRRGPRTSITNDEEARAAFMRGPVSAQYPAVFDDFRGAGKLKTFPTLLVEDGGETLDRSRRNIQLEGTWRVAAPGARAGG